MVAVFNKKAILLSCSSLLMISVHGAAFSQEVSGSSSANNSQSIDSDPNDIVVTGSYIKTDIAATKQAVPISVFTPSDIKASGSDNVASFLAKDGAFLGASSNQDGRGPDPSNSVTANIRGLGDRYTLTMVNGRRISVNDPGNLLYIPEAAIERLEVLKAGASALYGSDAVAGAVNVILKTSADKSTLDVRYADVDHGHAPTLTINGSTGFSNDSSRFFVAATYYKRKTLDEDARELTLNDYFGRFEGDRPEFDFTDYDYTAPAKIIGVPGRGPLVVNTDLVPAGSFSLDPTSYRDFDPARDGFDRPSDLIPKSERLSLYSRVEHDLGGGDFTVFAEGLFLYFNSTGKFSTAPVTTSLAGGVPATNPYNPFGIDFPDLNLRIFERGAQSTQIKSYSGRALAGIRGKIGGLTAEATATYLRDDARNIYTNGVSISGLRAALNRPGADAFNPFCNLCNTDAQLSGVLLPGFTSSESLAIGKALNLNLSGPAFDLPWGTVSFAAGAEYRKETTSLKYDNFIQSGDLFDVSSNQPQRLARNIKSVFGEVRIPLLPTDTANNPLELTLAVRHEDYSDAGTATKPLASLRWEAIKDNLVFRGSWSKSFRAPFLQELSNSTEQGQIFVQDPDSGQAVIAAVVTGSNPDLKPELATTYSAGFVYTPTWLRSLQVSVDYFNVKQKNLIVSPSPQLVVDGIQPGQYLTDGFAQGYSEQFVVIARLANAAGRTVEGIDSAISYTLDSGNAGVFNFNAGATRLLKFSINPGDGSGSTDYLGTYTLFATGGDIRAVPKWKGRASINWSFNNAAVTGAWNYIGGFADDASIADDPANPPYVPSQSTFDLMISYNLGSLVYGSASSRDRNLILSVGAENILNNLPPYSRGALYSAAYNFDNNIYDIRGRYLFASLSASF